MNRWNQHPRVARLLLETLEDRVTPVAGATLNAGLLTIAGGNEVNRITVLLDATKTQLLVKDGGTQIGSFAVGSVTQIQASLGAGHDTARIAADVTAPATLQGGLGNDQLFAGGGPSQLEGGDGADRLYGGNLGDVLLGGSGNDFLRLGNGIDNVDGGAGSDLIERIQPTDTVAFDALDRRRFAPVPAMPLTAVLPSTTVQQLLNRASAATQSQDAIIAIVDRNGRILGVRTEDGVNAAALTPEQLTFFIDGAVAKARTAAFFANNAAPLTSRTVQFISQTTMTQREIESNPNDASEFTRGPGFVAPIGLKGHFPPNIPFTPQVDLFAIEHTNRDSAFGSPGQDGLRGVATANDVTFPNQTDRFNIARAAFEPGKQLFAPESYGRQSGIFDDAQSRGIATLPGGVPIYEFRKKANGTFERELVGGIGVFFPGATGWATEENSRLNVNFDPTMPDRSLEAEYIAFAALNGSIDIPFGTLGGVPPTNPNPMAVGFINYGIPFDSRTTRIDLVGITLDVFGPGGMNGRNVLKNFAKANPPALVPNGTDQPVNPANDQFLAGMTVSDGWIVPPRAGVNFTAAQVQTIIEAGIAEANKTRAAIRLPLDSRTRMVFAIADANGEILGLFRMPDATVFSIDVAVAKARNVAYYADAAALEADDRLDGIAPGTALTNRTFRYLSLPRYPEGIDGKPPGVWSILTDGGVDNKGLTVGAPKSVFDFDSVQGHDAFFPGTNFRDNDNPANQNGIVFFPGSAALYFNGVLIGGLGVSGDGVDQDDVVTAAGAANFQAPNALRSDQFFFRGVRLPYQKFNRKPQN